MLLATYLLFNSVIFYMCIQNNIAENHCLPVEKKNDPDIHVKALDCQDTQSRISRRVETTLDLLFMVLLPTMHCWRLFMQMILLLCELITQTKTNKRHIIQVSTKLLAIYLLALLHASKTIRPFLIINGNAACLLMSCFY